jgi:hypothetical protein
MDFTDQISDEARARLLALLKQRDALELALLDISKGEVERIGGAHRDLILSQLDSQRAFLAEYDCHHQYEYMAENINGRGIAPAIELARPVGRFEKLLTFLGFDLWTHRAKRS